MRAALPVIGTCRKYRCLPGRKLRKLESYGCMPERKWLGNDTFDSLSCVFHASWLDYIGFEYDL